MAAEEIAAEYPNLTLAQVYAAMPYYHANRPEMDADVAAEQAESDGIEQEHLSQQRRGGVNVRLWFVPRPPRTGQVLT